MSLMNKNFRVDDKVKFVRTGDNNLEGVTGTIIGTPMGVKSLCDFYVVLLDTPYLGQKGIWITEACIDPV